MNILNIFKRPKAEPPQVDWNELYQQTGDNIRYLTSHIKVLNARIEDLKNRAARNSREKIKALTSTRDWMQLKLEEEKINHQIFFRFK